MHGSGSMKAHLKEQATAITNWFTFLIGVLVELLKRSFK